MNTFFQFEGPLYRVLVKIWSLLVLNLCIIVTSLPLVTIGVSLTAAYSVCFKLNEFNDTRIIQNYLEAFKVNFKQGIGFSFIHLLVVFVLFVDLRYLIIIKGGLSIALIGVVIVGVLLLFFSQFVYGYIARYQDSTKTVIVNTIKFFLLNIGTSLVLVMITVAIIFGILSSPILFVFVMYLSIFIGFSFIIFLKSLLVLNVFKKYEQAKEK